MGLCLDTARLLNQGPVEPPPALNSFYARSQAQGHAGCFACTPGWTADKGAAVVLVTHQVTIINAFTREGIASGGGSLFALNGSGEPRLLGSIKPD
jgi:hypothetical protein